jgi:rhomboid protease GluP
MLILSLAMIGITAGPAWIFVWVGWGLFALLIALPRFLFNRLQSKLDARDYAGSMKCAQYLKCFNWDLNGLFWQDMVRVMDLYMQGEKQMAEALIDKWQSDKLPARINDNLQISKMTGLTILLAWQEIIDYWQNINRSSKDNDSEKTFQSLAPFAVRAYCELGKIKEAANCLQSAKLLEARLSTKSIALTALPFFCLSGAKEKVEKILSLLSKGKDSVPEYLRLYWWGRLLTAVGEREKSKEVLTRSLAKSPIDLIAVRKRIHSAIAVVEQERRLEIQPPPDWSKPVEDVWRIFAKCLYVRSILAPSNHSVAVSALIGFIIVTFLLSNASWLFPDQFTEALRFNFYDLGMLTRNGVLAGQYWRLFTYLFLHANLLHLGLNLIALNWFGHIAENIYGTKRFLCIYMVSGALSGVAHVLLSPDIPAIGASGAIMGIFAAVAVGIFRLKEDIPRVIRHKELLWMALLALSQVILDHVIPHVASFAHLGGLLAGMAIAFLVTIPKPQDAPIIIDAESK